jgi:nucleotide-binding universal stress UspA family protein
MHSHDILVPTDFRFGSRLAIERAMRSLGPDGGSICVLHVIDQRLIEQILDLVPHTGEAELRTQLEQQARKRYAELVAGLPADRVEFTPLIVEGRPFLKIIQLARDLDVDMIVMTVHRGTTQVEQFLFGSTAERVLRLAPCPVLVVPETTVASAAEPMAGAPSKA